MRWPALGARTGRRSAGRDAAGVDPSAAGYANDAIELCRTAGSPEQLALALPTAAMVCWQVGAPDDARGYIAEARPMHRDTRRIARVVLLSTMASVALAEGDTATAVDHGRSADREGTELGIEREMPHARSMLAQALLAAGDLPGAVDRSLAAVRSAHELAFNFPLAIALETAVLVGLEAGLSRVELGILLATADRRYARAACPLPGLLSGLSSPHAGNASVTARCSVNGYFRRERLGYNWPLAG